jgi:hypothetical protein
MNTVFQSFILLTFVGKRTHHYTLNVKIKLWLLQFLIERGKQAHLSHQRVA